MNYEYPVEVGALRVGLFRYDLYQEVLKYLREQCGDNAPEFTEEDLDAYIDRLGWFSPVPPEQSKLKCSSYWVSPYALEDYELSDDEENHGPLLTLTDEGNLEMTDEGHGYLVHHAVPDQVVSALSK